MRKALEGAVGLFEVQLTLVLILLELLLVSDVPSDLVFVQTDGTHAIPPCPETPAEHVPFVFNSSRWIRVALLPFRYPIVMATLYLGGTLSSMWMWSGIALPANRQRIANMFPPA